MIKENIQQKSEKFGFYLLLFMLIFGTKLYTIIDITIITSLCIIMYYFVCLKKNIDSFILSLEVIIALLIIYFLIVALFTGSIDIMFGGKFIRAALSLLAIYLLIANTKMNDNDLVNIIVNLLFLHSIIVTVSATLFIDLQEILRPISGFQSNVLRFRSTGLTTGFDFSGLLCVLGLFILASSPNNLRIPHRSIKLIIFLISSLLTSRFSMIICELTIILIVFINVKRKKKGFENTFLLGFLVLTGIPVLFLLSISMLHNNTEFVQRFLHFDFFVNIYNNFTFHYANSNLVETTMQHFDFSGLTSNEFIMGAMQNAGADPGYTNYIYAIGCVGLFITMLFYLRILFYISKRRRKFRQTSISSYNKGIVLYIVFCVLVLSFKNSYLFARYISELLFCFLTMYVRRCREIKLSSSQRMASVV